MSNGVVEWAPFTTRPGVDDARLLRASHALQAEFLDRQRGFVRRELLKGPDGQWVDLVYWDSASAAEEAMKNAAGSPACFEYFQLMAGADHAEPGAGVSHFERVAVFGER